MPQGGQDGRWLRRIYIALVTGALLVVVAVIGSLMIDVQRRLEGLDRASSDNVQWSLAQLEVETSLLRETLGRDDFSLDDIRQRFDIFLSRFDIFDKSSLFEDLRLRPEFAGSLAEYRAFIGWALPILDGPDDELRSRLPEMLKKAIDLRPSARAISMAGIDYFTSRSDRERMEVAQTLRNVAWLTTILVLALSILAFVLFRLNHRTRLQALENAATTARLKTVVESSADAILVVDREGTASEFNPAAEAIFGYSRDEVIDRVASELLLPPETFDETIEQIESRIIDAQGRLTGQERMEIEAMRKNGRRFPVELTIVGTRGAEGEIAVVFLRDISDRRRAEADLLDARDKALQSERAKAEFLAMMSHEMRTPLNGLLGSIEILAATGLTPRQHEVVDIIETSGNVLLGHVNAVLDVSSAEAGALRLDAVPFSVEALVAEVVANQSGLAETAGNTIDIVPASEPAGRVIGDPGRLRQILLNLVGNAVKFTTHGKITVEIEVAPTVGAVQIVEFRVIDSGIGIAETDQGRIFEDFVTLDRSYGRAVDGTGLGLGITRRIVQAMGGEIGVESEPGSGSLFWVRLPFTPAALSPGDATGEATEPSPVRRILVIEDNAINRFVLRTLLEEGGHLVTEAVDGLDGVAVAEQTRFDVILMDISMPHLDGIEAARRVRQGNGASQAARIVAVTAHALPDELVRFSEAGMDDCLVKPITRSGLSAVIEGRPIMGPMPGRPDATLDQETLDDLLTHLGPATLDGLLARFLIEGDAAISVLDPEADTESAHRLAHRLTGSAATFGARRLAQELGELDLMLRQGLPVTWALDDLRMGWVVTRAAIVQARARIAAVEA